MRIFTCLIVFALHFGRAAGQLEKHGFSSIQFVNAASNAQLRLQVGDQIWHPAFAPGQITSAGAFPQLSWPIRLFSINERTKIEVEFDARTGRSYTAVIVGDFERNSGDLSEARSMDRENSPKEEVRAKILFLPNEIAPNEGHRLRVINGLIGTPINFFMAGSDRMTTAFGDMHTLSGLPAATRLRVEAGDRVFNLSFLFVPPERGCTIAFYRSGDQIAYVSANEVVLNPDGSVPSASQEEIERILNEFESKFPVRN